MDRKVASLVWGHTNSKQDSKLQKFNQKSLRKRAKVLVNMERIQGKLEGKIVGILWGSQGAGCKPGGSWLGPLVEALRIRRSFKDKDLRRLEGGCVSRRVVRLKVSGVQVGNSTGTCLCGSEPQKAREGPGARGALPALGRPLVTSVCRCPWLLLWAPALLGVHPPEQLLTEHEAVSLPSLCSSFAGGAWCLSSPCFRPTTFFKAYVRCVLLL